MIPFLCYNQQRGHQDGRTRRMSCSLRFFFDVVGMCVPWFVVCSEQRIFYHRHQEEPGTIGNDHPSIISATRAPGAHELLTTDLLWCCGECYVPWFVVCSELWIFYHRHQGNQAPSTTIIHPSYHNEGTRANELLTTVLLWCHGEYCSPGLWYAQSKRSTANTRKNRVPSAMIIHPSYHNGGTRANELLTTVLLWCHG